MQNGLTQAIGDAVAEGIVSGEQADRLREHFSRRGLIAAKEGGLLAELVSESRDEPAPDVEESEAPRFIRGFHDILITIGVIAALVGLWGLAPVLFGLGESTAFSALAVFAATIVLAEILVKRQRLALPAFVLTAAYCAAAFSFVAPLASAVLEIRDGPLVGVAVFFVSPLVVLPFYLRYRVPAALAAMLAMLALLAFTLALALLDAAGGPDELSAAQGRSIAAIALVAVLALFAVAMAFDMSDPQRRTRRSDVAFWLHLMVAPALLFSVFSTIFFKGAARLWWVDDPSYNEAIAAVAIIAAMMLIGIVIDRRAFVTSGLISLGVAIAVLARSAQIDMISFGALPLLLVGVIVLTLGIGWQALRAIIVTRLPAGLQRRLRPAH